MHLVEKFNYTLTVDFMNYQLLLCVYLNVSSIFVAQWRIFPHCCSQQDVLDFKS